MILYVTFVYQYQFTNLQPTDIRTDYSCFHLNFTYSLELIQSFTKYSLLKTTFKKSLYAFYWKVFQEFLPIFFINEDLSFRLTEKPETFVPLKLFLCFHAHFAGNIVCYTRFCKIFVQ